MIEASATRSPRDAMDAQLIIDDGHGIVTHLACADGKVGCLGILLYPVEQLIVFIQINTGNRLIGYDPVERRCCYDLPGSPHRFNRDVTAELRREEIETNFRCLFRIR